MGYQYNVSDGLTYWVDDAPTQEAVSAQQAEQQSRQQQVLDWYKNQGYEAFVPQIGQQYDRWGSTGGLYNAGNGVMAYVPTEGAAAEPFIAKPQQNSGFSNFAMGPIGTTLTHFQDVRNAYKENPERILYGGGFADTPLGTQGLNALLGTDYKPVINQTGGPTNQTYSNAAAQGYETGPTKVGHQLAPAAVGIGAASALAGTSGIPVGAEDAALATGATEGTVAGGSGTNAVYGNAGNDTLAGGNVGEDLLYDPSYYDQSVNYFQPNSADPYGTGVDIYGNPTGEYAPSTFSGDTANTGYSYNQGLGLNDYLNYGKQGLGLAQQYKGILGAAAGALAGKANGSKPAGTTTTTVDAPSWLQPYIQGNLAASYNTLQGINPNNPLLPASQSEAMKTIRGDYLNPSSNPYFAQSVNDALGLAQSNYLGLYGGSAGTNVNNTGFQEGLARGLGAAATNAYNTNYQTERGRQAQMTATAPQLVSQSNAAMFSPNQAFAGLVPGFTSTTVPYFQNNLGNMFSGALGGYALSKAV